MYGEDTSLWEMGPPSSLSELIKRVGRLELIARKNAYGILSGYYQTNIRGKGIEFQEARKYVYGESIRQIDWNITARMNEPYVRIFHEEREREIFIVLDVSPSMYSGWQSRRKIEYAVEIAATIAFSAVSARDKLGYIVYSDKAHVFSRPAGGNAQFFRVVKELYQYAVSEPAPCSVSDMREAIHAIQRHRGKRFMIFFISDFIDYDVPVDLRYLQARHDVTLLHIYDPFEYKELHDISFIAASPEGSKIWKNLSPGQTGTIGEIQNFLKKQAGKYQIAFKSISTKTSMSRTIKELFNG